MIRYCSHKDCRADAVCGLLGVHPLCRFHADQKNAKTRQYTAKRRELGLYSPSIVARMSEATKRRRGLLLVALLSALALSGCATNYLEDYNVRAGVPGSVTDLKGAWTPSGTIHPQSMTQADIAAMQKATAAMQNINVVFTAQK